MRTGLGVLASLLLLAAGCAIGWFVPRAMPASGASITLPGVSYCGNGKPVQRPGRIVLTCADAGMVLHSVRWTVWGSGDALGQGTVTVNSCQPDCADGEDISYPAEIVLDRVIPNGVGPQFSRWIVIYQDRTPDYSGRVVELGQLPLASGH